MAATHATRRFHVAVLALGMAAVLERHVRTAVGEALEAPFVLAARAHGIPAPGSCTGTRCRRRCIR